MSEYEAEGLPACERCGYRDGSLFGAEGGDDTVAEVEQAGEAVLVADDGEDSPRPPLRRGGEEGGGGGDAVAVAGGELSEDDLVGAVALEQGTDGGGVGCEGDEGITFDDTDFACGVGLQRLRGTAGDQ